MTYNPRTRNNRGARSKAGEPVIVRVTKEHHIALARQAAQAIARRIGFKQAATYYIATSVSELAGNLVFHTDRGGSITLIPLERSDAIGIEIVAEDEGPGIPDMDLAMQDGFSTGGGLGSGLPGVKRLMDEFEITSTPGVGTRIVTRKWQSCR